MHGFKKGRGFVDRMSNSADIIHVSKEHDRLFVLNSSIRSPIIAGNIVHYSVFREHGFNICATGKISHIQRSVR